MFENYSYERTINIKNLIYKIVKKLHIIIIVGLVCALIGGGYTYLNNKKENQTVQAALNDDLNASSYGIDVYTINNYIETCSEMARLKDDMAYNPRLNYKDGAREYTNTLIYKINSNSDNYEGITSYLKTVILSDEVLDNLVEENNLTTDSKYYTYKDFLNEMIIVNPDNDSSDEINNEVASDTILVSISINDKTIADNIANSLKEVILKAASSIETMYNASLNFVDENSVSIVPDNSEELVKMQDEITDLKDFKDTSVAYLNNLNLKYLSAKYPAYSVSVSSGVTKKAIIFGLGGCFVALVCICIKYLFGSKFEDSKEISSRKVNVYGTINQSKYNSFIDKLFGKDVQTSKETTISKIKLDLQNRNINEVIIASTLKDDHSIKETLETLNKEFKVKETYFDILENAKFFEACDKQVSVIYVEKLRETKIHDLDNLATLSNQLKINDLGIIIID